MSGGNPDDQATAGEACIRDYVGVRDIALAHLPTAKHSGALEYFLNIGVGRYVISTTEADRCTGDLAFLHAAPHLIRFERILLENAIDGTSIRRYAFSVARITKKRLKQNSAIERLVLILYYRIYTKRESDNEPHRVRMIVARSRITNAGWNLSSQIKE